MSSTGSAPILCATDCYRVRYSLLSLFLFVTAVALGLGLGIQLPGFTVWIGAIAITVCIAIALTPAAIDGYRRMFLKCPTKLVPLYGDANFDILLWSHHLLVGRNSCCDIVLSSPTVSERHCGLYVIGRRLYVEDLHSSNGTYLNGRSIQTGRLLIGDKISIADREFVVR